MPPRAHPCEAGLAAPPPPTSAVPLAHRTQGYGKVFLVRKVVGDDRGKVYAMKVLSKVGSQRRRARAPRLVSLSSLPPSPQATVTTQSAMKERDILMAVRAIPFVVGMHYAFQSESRLHLVLDFMAGGASPASSRRRGPRLMRAAAQASCSTGTGRESARGSTSFPSTRRMRPVPVGFRVTTGCGRLASAGSVLPGRAGVRDRVPARPWHRIPRPQAGEPAY